MESVTVLEEALSRGSTDDLKRLMQTLDDNAFPPIMYEEYSRSPYTFARAIVSHGRWDLRKRSDVEKLVNSMNSVNKTIGNTFQSRWQDQLGQGTQTEVEDPHIATPHSCSYNWESERLQQENQKLRQDLAHANQRLRSDRELHLRLQQCEDENRQLRLQLLKYQRTSHQKSSTGPVSHGLSQKQLETIFGCASNCEVLRRIAHAIGNPTTVDLDNMFGNPTMAVSNLALYAVQNQITKDELVQIVRNTRGAGRCISIAEAMKP